MNVVSRDRRKEAGWTDRYSARSFSRLAVALAIAASLAACNEGHRVEGDQLSDRIFITNTQSLLDPRISYPNEPVPIDNDPMLGLAMAAAAAPIAVTLTLVSEISPPIVEGEVVQATSISRVGGDKAVVSYNMGGAPRLGAIDYITKLKKKTPTLSSEAIFNDSDISAVSTDGKWVYAAEATDAEGFTYPAVFERLKVKGNKLSLQGNARVPLTSFAATSTMTTDDEIYATSGDGGDIFAFDEKDLELLGQFPLDDARWVAWDKEGWRIVVVQGTPGRISIFAEGEFPGGSMDLIDTFPFPGADVPESKSTLEIAGGKAFIAAGPEGVQIMCLDDGQIVGSVPRPDPASLGLDSEVVVTNAVTLDKGT